MILSKIFRIKTFLLPLLAYCGLSLVATYPLVTVFGSFFIGGAEDGSMSYWTLWWVKFSLLSLHQDPFNCQYLFFPNGVNLVFHSIPKVMTAIYIPLSGIFSLVVAYNLVILFTFVASGMAAYWLALRLIGSPLPAFLAGAFFTFSPYHIGQISHVNLMPEMLIPVYILLIMRGREAQAGGGGGWVTFVLAGLALALMAYDTEHYAIFLVVFSLLYLVFYLPWKDGEGGWQQWRRLLSGIGLTMLVSVIVFSPMLVAAARQIQAQKDFVTLPGQLNAYSAHLGSFFLPRANGTLIGKLPSPLTLPGDAEITYFGWTILVLAVVGVWSYWKRRETRLWLLTAVVFAVLAMGPVLYIAHRSTGIPMPYKIINLVPLLNSIRTPERYVVITSLALALLAGFGAIRIFDSLKKYRRSGLLTAALVIVMLGALFAEAKSTISLVSTRTPPVYNQIAASGASGSVVSLPLGWETASTGFAGQEQAFVELFQLVHQKPLVGGTVARAPSSLIETMSEAPVLHFLSHPDSPPSAADLDPGNITRSMNRYQISFIVVQKLYPPVYYQGRFIWQPPTILDATTLERIDRYVTGNLKMERFADTSEIVAYRRLQGH